MIRARPSWERRDHTATATSRSPPMHSRRAVFPNGTFCTLQMVSNQPESNPYSPPHTTSKPVRASVPDRRPWSRYLGVLQLLVIVIGAPLSVWQIETILGSGACLFLLGLAMALFAYRERNYWTLALGFAGLSYALFVLVVINAMSWGPSEARKPVSIMNVSFASLYSLPLLYGIFLSGKSNTAETANAEVPGGKPMVEPKPSRDE